MIAQLTGKIIFKTEEGIVLDVAGVGYEILGSKLQSLPTKSATIFIKYHVGSDNNPSLYGFIDYESKKLFLQFLSVSGIGPKTAMKILNSDVASYILEAIAEDDTNYFAKIKGVSKKAAQKIILELKNKLVLGPDNQEDNLLYEALLSLKFTRKEIASALNRLSLAGLSDQAKIQAVLKELGKK